MSEEDKNAIQEATKIIFRSLFIKQQDPYPLIEWLENYADLKTLQETANNDYQHYGNIDRLTIMSRLRTCKNKKE